MVTKKGYNPTEVWPKRTGNKTGAIDAVLTVLTPPVIIKIPEGKVGTQKFNSRNFLNFFFPKLLVENLLFLDALCWAISKIVLYWTR